MYPYLIFLQLLHKAQKSGSVHDCIHNRPSQKEKTLDIERYPIVLAKKKK